MTVLSYRSTLRTAIYAAAWLMGLMALADVAAANEDATNGAAAETSASADKPAKDAAGELNDGRLIRIRLPLVGNADRNIKTSIQRAIEQLGKSPRHQGRRPILVLELEPARRHAGYGEGTDFERAVSVA